MTMNAGNYTLFQSNQAYTYLVAGSAFDVSCFDAGNLYATDGVSARLYVVVMCNKNPFRGCDLEKDITFICRDIPIVAPSVTTPPSSSPSSTPMPSSGGPLSDAALLGIIISGSILVVAAIVSATVLVMRHRNRSRDTTESSALLQSSNQAASI